MNPDVSLCIPTYNGAAYVRQCLDSALAQTFQNIEIVVVDDASTDETTSIIESYIGYDERVRLYVNNTNRGLVGNWNRCVELAKGEWIKFLFQDDYLDCDCVWRMFQAIDPSDDLVVCRRSFVFAPNTSTSLRRTYLEYDVQNSIRVRFPEREEIAGDDFAAVMLRMPYVNCIGEPTATLLKRSAAKKFGYFDSRLLHLCDWEYLARVAVNRGLRYVDEPLAFFRVHEKAESALNRTSRSYRSEFLDPLIVAYQLVYSPHYRPVREIARLSDPAVNLKQRLLWVLSEAKREAQRLAKNDPTAAASSQFKELEEIQKLCPKLQYLPVTYAATHGVGWLKNKFLNAVHH